MSTLISGGRQLYYNPPAAPAVASDVDITSRRHTVVINDEVLV